MSIEPISTGDKFYVRIFKYFNEDPSVEWSNVYELMATNDSDLATLKLAAQNLLRFEEAFHFDKIFFPRLVLGTWQPDSHPYDPESFCTIEFSTTEQGLIPSPIATSMLPLNVCLALKRNAVSGRSGKIYYRGCLQESDVETVSGMKWILTSGATWTTTLNTAKTLHLDDLLGDAAGPFRLSMIGKNKAGTLFTRGLTDITLHGVADVQMTHRWYNRRTVPA